MASYYEHKYDEFGDQVLRAPWMVALMHSRATAIHAAALALSPVDTGEYVDSFTVTSGVRRTGRTRRAYGRVANTAPHALAVEFGWGPTPKYRVLGKALGAGGGKIGAGT